MIATMSGVVISYNFMGFVFIFWTSVLNTSCNISIYLLCMLLLYVFATETDDFA